MSELRGATAAEQPAPAREPDLGNGQGNPTRSERLPGWVAIVGPALAALVVGGYQISGPSLWRDEAATISGSQRPLSSIMALTLHQDAVHGAYYLLIHAVIAVGGSAETALRLPSLIATCLAAGLIAALGRRLAQASGLPVPKLTGLLAGLAYVVVPLTTRYAQEARPYALTTLFAAAATYLLVRAAPVPNPISDNPISDNRILDSRMSDSRMSDSPDAAPLSHGSWSWWAGYAAALTLTGLVNLFAVLLIVAHGVSLLAAKTALKRWLAAAAAASVLLIPLAVASIRQSGQLNWVTRPDPSTVATLMRDFSGTTVVIPVVVLLAVVGCVAGVGVRRGQGLTLAVVTLPWLIGPPVLLIAISLADPLYVERYVVFCLPALSVLVAAGLVWLAKLTGQAALARGFTAGRLRLIAVLPSVVLAIAVVAALIGPQRAIRLPSARADNLRAVAAILAAHEQPGDAIVYLPWDTAVIGNAYPGAYAKLRDIGLSESPVASATLRGLPVPPGVLAARLRTVSRAWTVQWFPALPSAGPVRTALVTASGLRLVRRWRVASVLLSLYARG